MSRTVLKKFQETAVGSACGYLGGCLSNLGRIPSGLADTEVRRARVIARQGGLLFEAPTGTGKTLMAGETAEKLSLSHKIIWFWFAPFEGLISQSASTFRDEFPSLRVRDLSKDREPEHLASGDVFLTTWASVAVAVAASRKIRQETEELPSVDVLLERAREAGFNIGVVVDEAHHSFRKDTQAMAFYRDVLKPDVTILVTATPDDRDVTEFENAIGLKTQHISVSRKQGMEAGLLKKGVKAAIFKARNPKDAPLIDFRRTAVMQGVRQHLAVKAEFERVGINLVPLLLVQVENTTKAPASDTPDIKTVQSWITSQGIPAERIKIHTADEPTPDLIGVAHDEEVEVLIFKMSVAMGFDAPRAHTLVSLRPTRDTNFGIQIVGRIMRVHRKVQAASDVPEALQYGYVLLADHESQDGLLQAAQRIKSIKDELAPLTQSVQVMESGDVVMVDPTKGPDMLSGTSGASLVDGEGGTVQEQSQETISGLDQEGKVASVESQEVDGTKPSLPSPSFGGGQSQPQSQPQPQQPLFPMGSLATAPETAPGTTPSQNGGGTPAPPSQAFEYKRRNDLDFPIVLKQVVLQPKSADILRDLVNLFNLTPDLLNTAMKDSAQVLMERVEVFEHTKDKAITVSGNMAQRLVAEFSQRTLFDVNHDGFMNDGDLQKALEEKLRTYAEQSGHAAFAEDPKKVRSGMEKILALHPGALRKSLSLAVARHTECQDAPEPLPESIVSDEQWDPAALNTYGVFHDLNSWEREFADLIDNDTTGIVLWWHRNCERKKHSVVIPIPGQPRFWPDFVVGVQGRKAPGILLVETKRDINDEKGNAHLKSVAQHPDYGKVMMLYWNETDDIFLTVEYDAISDKNQLTMAFNDLKLMQSF